METSGALKKKAQYPATNYYANMVAAGANSPYIGDINKVRRLRLGLIGLPGRLLFCINCVSTE